MKRRPLSQQPAVPAGHRRRLRRRVRLFWALLTLTVFGVVLLVLSAADVFPDVDQQLRAGLEPQLESTSTGMQTYLDQLTARSLSLSASVSQEIEALLMHSGRSFEELNDDPDQLLELQRDLCGPVKSALEMSNCSGAYAVLDVTANTQAPEAAHSRSGLYLRCVNISGSNLVDPDIKCFRGIPAAARQKDLELHNRWNLEFDTSLIPGYEEMIGQQVSRPAEHYYWTEKLPLKDTWEEALLLCVPIMGDSRRVYGVCGMEISALFFQLAAPARQTEFGPVVTVLAPLEDGRLMLQKGLIGGVSGTYLDRPDGLTVHQGRECSVYTGDTGRYVGLQQRVEISQEDEEYRQWVVALLLPGEHYDACVAASHQRMLLLCLGIFAGLSLLAALLCWRLMGPIERIVDDYARQGGSKDELDRLIGFVQAGPPEELFDCERFPEDIEQALEHFARRAAVLTGHERQLFLLLTEGVPPDGLPARMGMNRRRVRGLLELMCEQLGAATVEGVLLYLDFFRRCGRLDQLRRE